MFIGETTHILSRLLFRPDDTASVTVEASQVSVALTPALASRSGLSTADDSMEIIAAKLAELVAL